MGKKERLEKAREKNDRKKGQTGREKEGEGEGQQEGEGEREKEGGRDGKETHWIKSRWLYITKIT